MLLKILLDGQYVQEKKGRDDIVHDIQLDNTAPVEGEELSFWETCLIDFYLSLIEVDTGISIDA